ncbi:hypothetical protein VPH35_011542 [Triticum aestivum]
MFIQLSTVTVAGDVVVLPCLRIVTRCGSFSNLIFCILGSGGCLFVVSGGWGSGMACLMLPVLPFLCP